MSNEKIIPSHQESQAALASLKTTLNSLTCYLELSSMKLTPTDFEHIRTVVATLRVILKEDLSLHSADHVSGKLLALSAFTQQLIGSSGEFSLTAETENLMSGFRRNLALLSPNTESK